MRLCCTGGVIMDRLRKIAALILIVIGVACGATAATDYLEKKSAEDQFQEIREKTAITAQEAVKTQGKGYQAPQGLLALMKANSSVIGWLKIEDTNIDYPIVQNKEDNEWFLHRDINGNESQPGSIFLEANHDIHDKGIHVVYGHHMRNGTMFKDIYRYRDTEYFENHKEITIWTDECRISLEPVYCYAGKEDRSYRKIYNPGEELEKFLLEKTGLRIPSDNIFVFVTCSYGRRDDRCYLICREGGGNGTY